MTTMITLEPSRYIKRRSFGFEKCIPIRKSVPFAESSWGSYTHRVRTVTLHNNGGKAHFSVQCWCGMSLNFGGSGKGGGRLVENPTEGRPMCATCEGRAIGVGLLGSREIDGRAVMYRAGGAT